MIRKIPKYLIYGCFLVMACWIEPALAQSSTNTTNTPGSPVDYNMKWSLLDPGDDWAAQVLRSVFPVVKGSSQSTGTEAQVIGTLLGYMTGFVGAFAMAFVIYTAWMQVYRGSETARLLGTNQSSISIARIGFAAVMMFPTLSGFSVGQDIVVRSALLGIGMAKTVYAKAITAMGVDGEILSSPVIPGTKLIVSGLVQNEFCRAVINLASNNNNMIPAPTAQVKKGTVYYNYDTTNGNSNGSPACGSVTLRFGDDVNILGQSIDVSTMQKNALNAVLTQYIRGQVETIASNFWKTRNVSELKPLRDVWTSATNYYTYLLTQAATRYTSQLRSGLNSFNETLVNGTTTKASVDLTAAKDDLKNQTQMQALGWAGAGAYYVEFARLNGQVLSLLNETPTINTPNWDMLPDSIKTDMVAVIPPMKAYLDNLNSFAAVTDGYNSPGYNADTFSGSTPGGDGSTVLGQLFKSIHINDTALKAISDYMSPLSGNYWNNPFIGFMKLGHTLITVSLIALGTSALLSTTPGSIGSVIMGGISGGIGGAVAGWTASGMVKFLAPPIFLACFALLLPGISMAFVLPMIPWIMWMAGVTGWLVMVCEAMVAVPLGMMAHMSLNGEGMHGQARQFYSLLFNLIFRPVLMIFGLFLGYFIFTSMCWLVRMTFGIAASFALSSGWIVTNFVGIIVLLAIFVMVHFTLAITSFRMISIIPDHVPAILGMHGQNRIDAEGFKQAIAVAAIKKIEGGTQQLLTSMSLGENNGRSGLSKEGSVNDTKSKGSGMDSTTVLTSQVRPDSKE